MALLATDAIVLHVFDYLESSRILKLATRDAGIQSVLAKGMRRAGRKYGSAVDLFADGVAHIHTKPGRDLQTLASFDVVRARPEIAADLERFTGASAVAELALRFLRDDSHPALFDVLTRALDGLCVAEGDAAREAALAGAWNLVGELGFAPALDQCGECHAPIDPAATVSFVHRAGGVLCPLCARLAPSGRALPPEARSALRQWVAGRPSPLGEAAAARAHQRLLREFLVEHLSDGRALRAFDVWERDRWSAV